MQEESPILHIRRWFGSNRVYSYLCVVACWQHMLGLRFSHFRFRFRSYFLVVNSVFRSPGCLRAASCVSCSWLVAHGLYVPRPPVSSDRALCCDLSPLSIDYTDYCIARNLQYVLPCLLLSRLFSARGALHTRSSPGCRCGSWPALQRPTARFLFRCRRTSLHSSVGY